MGRRLRAVLMILLIASAVALFATTLACMLKLSGDYWFGTNRPYLMLYEMSATVALGGSLIATETAHKRRVVALLFSAAALLTVVEAIRLLHYMCWMAKPF